MAYDYDRTAGSKQAVAPDAAPDDGMDARAWDKALSKAYAWDKAHADDDEVDSSYSATWSLGGQLHHWVGFYRDKLDQLEDIQRKHKRQINEAGDWADQADQHNRAHRYG